MTRKIAFLILGLFLTGEAAWSQELPTVEPASAAPSENGGLWPSEKLLNLMLRRWADDVGRQFELDDRQQEAVTTDIVKRWSAFAKENRSELQPLLNEFVEMRMELEPPAKGRVAEWSKKAAPAFEKIREQFDKGSSEFRKVLTPAQRVEFELEALKFNAGLAFASQQLKQWQGGEFNPDVFWEPTRRERQKRREAKAKNEAKEEVASVRDEDPIEAELEAWEKFAKEFIERYQLEEGQRSTVLSCLAELRERALAHRERRKEDIAKLEARIKEPSESEEARAEIKKELTELYGPIDEMFQELKRRLEQVPSDAQRARDASENPAKRP